MALYLDRFNSEELTKWRYARPLVFSLNLVMLYLCFTFINIFQDLHLNQHLLLIAIKIQKYKFLCQITQYCVFIYNIMFLPYLQ